MRRLETKHEEGLTNAQLMLTNDDLKPGRIFLFLFLISRIAIAYLIGLVLWI